MIWEFRVAVGSEVQGVGFGGKDPFSLVSESMYPTPKLACCYGALIQATILGKPY